MKRIVIVGAGGRLGAALQRAYADNFALAGFDRATLDLNRLEEVRRELERTDFDLLINCAALTAVDYCEAHREEAFRVNGKAPRVLAEVCRTKGAQLIHVSTDYVFDGRKTKPYTEEDEAKPISVYGESKRSGETNVLKASADHIVARVSWVFGPDRPSFIDQVIARAKESEDVAAVADKLSTPTFTLDLAGWLKAAWEDRLSGLLHLANDGECSWQEYAQHALDCCVDAGMKLKGTQVASLALSEMKNFVARRPPYTVLSAEKFTRLTGCKPRHWREAVADYVYNYIARK